VHTPSELGRLQALQVPVQAVSQQTPSAQKPVRQSLSHAQASDAPFDCGAAVVEHTPSAEWSAAEPSA
jgi:hypothetical protein